MKRLPLDIVLPCGSEWEVEKKVALVIKKAGTDATSDAIIKVEERECLRIITDIAPLKLTSDNVLGPLDLGDLYIVVAPQEKLSIEGPSGAYVRLIGEQLYLEPGDRLGEPYLSRWDAQDRVKWVYVYGSVSLGTDEAWDKDVDLIPLTLSPGASEKYEINDILMMKVSGGTVSYNQIHVRFKYKDREVYPRGPFSGKYGIDILMLPWPPSMTNNAQPFKLKNLPFTVEEGDRLQIIARNVSGSALTPSSGSAWKVEAILLAKYMKS